MFLLFSAATCVEARKTCKDFSSQSEAQRYMEQSGDRRLDRDKDGEACDCLPGGNGTYCPNN